jgi:hypothetical protein
MLNNSFINVGRYYKITQFCMRIDWTSSVTFFFGNFYDHTQEFRFTPEQARHLIDFFKVYSLNLYSFVNQGDQFDHYWSLIDYFEG